MWLQHRGWRTMREGKHCVIEVADWWRRPNQCTGGGMTGTLTPTTIAVGPSGSHVTCSTCTIQSLVNVQITRFFVTLHQPLRLTWIVNMYRITHSSLWQEDRIAMEWWMPIWLFASGTLTYFTPVLLLLYPHTVKNLCCCCLHVFVLHP